MIQSVERRNMSRGSHKDFACLLNMLDAITKIEKYTSEHSSADEFYEDSQAFDATMMNFIVIGEMAEKLSDVYQDLTSGEVDWFEIRGLRNIVAHDYFGIDAEEIWQIINTHLQLLKSFIKQETGE